jgi:N-alpha-acetyltransferase 30
MVSDIYLVDDKEFKYCKYPGEKLIEEIMTLMSNSLSEPYPILTYRYFLNGWPDLCIMCFDKENKLVGGIIGGIEKTSKNKMKGYIAMIAIKEEYRGNKIAKKIVEIFIKKIKEEYKLNEIYLETEVDNKAALALYESVGFVRVRVNSNYYLNAKSAFRLKYFIPSDEDREILKLVDNKK